MVLLMAIAMVSVLAVLFMLRQTVARLVHTLRLAQQFEGPTAFPIIGAAYLFANKEPFEFLDVINRASLEYKHPIKFWLGPLFTTFIADPDMMKEVLSNAEWNEKSDEYDYLQSWLGQGLLLSSGKKWHQRRKALTPAFHFKILEDFIEVFDKRSSTLVEKLTDHSGNEKSLNIFPYIALYALDVICDTAMGVSVNAMQNTDSDYVKAVKTAAQVGQMRMFNLVCRTPLFFLTKHFWEQRHAVKVLHSYTDSVIAARRQELQNLATVRPERQQRTANDDIGMKRRRAFLDLLLEVKIDGQPLNDFEIREEVDTFMFEGHDTTTSAITFALLELAKNATVQEKVYEECISVIGHDPSKSITMNDLQNMHYLEMVIKETLRLYPSVPLIARKSSKDTMVAGKVIPAGSTILLGIYQMGRNPRYFDDPLAFVPERFSQENSIESQHPYKYVPFSAGARNCIGQKFAMLEMKSVLSKLVRNFEIFCPTNGDGLQLGSELILKPYPGVMLQFRQRH